MDHGQLLIESALHSFKVGVTWNEGQVGSILHICPCPSFGMTTTEAFRLVLVWQISFHSGRWLILKQLWHVENNQSLAYAHAQPTPTISHSLRVIKACQLNFDENCTKTWMVKRAHCFNCTCNDNNVCSRKQGNVVSIKIICRNILGI